MDTNLVSSVMAMITKKLSPRAHRQTSAYTDLAHRIRASGLLDRSPRRYVVRALILAAGFAIGLWSLFALGNSWWQLLIAVGFGLRSEERRVGKEGRSWWSADACRYRG